MDDLKNIRNDVIYGKFFEKFIYLVDHKRISTHIDYSNFREMF